MTQIYNGTTARTSSAVLAGQVSGPTSATVLSNAAVVTKLLTGVDSNTPGTVTATDSLLTGIGKLSGTLATATSSNTAQTIVKRGAAGESSHGALTTNQFTMAPGAGVDKVLTSNGSGVGTWQTPTLSGDVTGAITNTTVASVNGKTASEVSTAVTDVQSATSNNTASTIAKRSATGGLNADNLQLGTNVWNRTLNIGVPATVGNTVQFMRISSIGGGVQHWTISVTLSTAGVAECHLYNVAIVYNGTGGAWQRLTPISSRPLTNPTIALDCLSNNDHSYLRITRLQGYITVTARINLISNVYLPSMTFDDTQSTYAAGSPALYVQNLTLPGTLTVTTGIIGNLTGNASTVTTIPNLTGEVTSVGNATTVVSVGGSTAASINAAEVAANSATSANTASAIVKRDVGGGFIANNVTMSTLTVNGNASITGTLSGYKEAVVPVSGSNSFGNQNTSIVFILSTGATMNLPTPVGATGVIWHLSLSSTATSGSITTAAGSFYGPQFIGTNPIGWISGKTSLSASQPGANISVMSDGANWVVRGAAMGWN